jgi:hypothetical protein
MWSRIQVFRPRRLLLECIVLMGSIRPLAGK